MKRCGVNVLLLFLGLWRKKERWDVESIKGVIDNVREEVREREEKQDRER